MQMVAISRWWPLFGDPPVVTRTPKTSPQHSRIKFALACNASAAKTRFVHEDVHTERASTNVGAVAPPGGLSHRAALAKVKGCTSLVLTTVDGFSVVQLEIVE